MTQRDQWHGMAITIDKMIFAPFLLFYATIIFVCNSVKAILSIARKLSKTNIHVSSSTLKILHYNAESYDVFYQTGAALDIAEKHSLWKNDPSSIYYDHAILRNRLDHMIYLSKTKDFSKLVNLLRGILIRNFCGISNPSLYSKSHVGTKLLIEQYIHEIVTQLHHIYRDGLNELDDSISIIQNSNDTETFIRIRYHDDAIISNPSPSIPNKYGPSRLSKSPLPFVTSSSPSSLAMQTKLDFFSECLQTFGRTALFLTGGITLGLYHLGIAKTLYDHSILPNIICGTSIGGALVASIICTRPCESKSDDGLSVLFSDPGSFINFSVFEKDHRYSGSFKRKIIRFLKHGHLLDSSVIQSFIRDNIGDLTFAEAYQRSRMILNIVIPGSRKNGPPLLLNYLTAPDVLIWSAACASGTLPGLYEPVSLYLKSSKGEITTWYPKELLGTSATYRLEEVFARLSGLFNVNHIILSKVVPWNLSLINHLFPLNGNLPHSTPLISRFLRFMFDEFKHRVNQLHQLHLLPRSFSRVLISHSESYSRKFNYSYGNRNKFVNSRRPWVATNSNNSISITEISPHVSLSDLPKIFSPLSEHLVRCLVSKGEKVSWAHISRLRNMMLIECTLDHLSNQLKKHSYTSPIHIGYDIGTSISEPAMFRSSLQNLDNISNNTDRYQHQHNRKRSRTVVFL